MAPLLMAGEPEFDNHSHPKADEKHGSDGEEKQILADTASSEGQNSRRSSRCGSDLQAERVLEAVGGLVQSSDGGETKKVVKKTRRRNSIKKPLRPDSQAQRILDCLSQQQLSEDAGLNTTFSSLQPSWGLENGSSRTEDEQQNNMNEVEDTLVENTANASEASVHLTVATEDKLPANAASANVEVFDIATPAVSPGGGRQEGGIENDGCEESNPEQIAKTADHPLHERPVDMDPLVPDDDADYLTIWLAKQRKETGDVPELIAASNEEAELQGPSEQAASARLPTGSRKEHSAVETPRKQGPHDPPGKPQPPEQSVQHDAQWDRRRTWSDHLMSRSPSMQPQTEDLSEDRTPLPEDDPPQNPVCMEDVLPQGWSLETVFGCTKAKDKAEALKELSTALGRCPQLDPMGDWAPLIKGMFTMIKKEAAIPVVSEAAKIVGLLARGLRNDFERFSKPCCTLFLEKICDRTLWKDKLLIASLELALHAVPFEMFFEEVKTYSNEKNPFPRKEVLLVISRALMLPQVHERNPDVVRQFVGPISEVGAHAMEDSIREIRLAAASLLALLTRMAGPEALQGVMKTLPPPKKELVDAELARQSGGPLPLQRVNPIQRASAPPKMDLATKAAAAVATRRASIQHISRGIPTSSGISGHEGYPSAGGRGSPGRSPRRASMPYSPQIQHEGEARDPRVVVGSREPVAISRRSLAASRGEDTSATSSVVLGTDGGPTTPSISTLSRGNGSDGGSSGSAATGSRARVFQGDSARPSSHLGKAGVPHIGLLPTPVYLRDVGSELGSAASDPCSSPDRDRGARSTPSSPVSPRRQSKVAGHALSRSPVGSMSPTLQKPRPHVLKPNSLKGKREKSDRSHFWPLEEKDLSGRLIEDLEIEMQNLVPANVFALMFRKSNQGAALDLWIRRLDEMDAEEIFDIADMLFKWIAWVLSCTRENAKFLKSAIQVFEKICSAYEQLSASLTEREQKILVPHLIERLGNKSSVVAAALKAVLHRFLRLAPSKPQIASQLIQGLQSKNVKISSDLLHVVSNLNIHMPRKSAMQLQKCLRELHSQSKDAKMRNAIALALQPFEGPPADKVGDEAVEEDDVSLEYVDSLGLENESYAYEGDVLEEDLESHLIEEEEEEVAIDEDDTLMLISALVQRLRTCEPKIVCSVCSQLCAAFERYSTEFAEHPERRLEPQQADQLTDTLAEAAPWVFRPQNLDGLRAFVAVLLRFSRMKEVLASVSTKALHKLLKQLLLSEITHRQSRLSAEATVILSSLLSNIDLPRMYGLLLGFCLSSDLSEEVVSGFMCMCLQRLNHQMYLYITSAADAEAVCDAIHDVVKNISPARQGEELCWPQSKVVGYASDIMRILKSLRPCAVQAWKDVRLGPPGSRDRQLFETLVLGRSKKEQGRNHGSHEYKDTGALGKKGKDELHVEEASDMYVARFGTMKKRYINIDGGASQCSDVPGQLSDGDSSMRSLQRCRDQALRQTNGDLTRLQQKIEALKQHGKEKNSSRGFHSQ